MSERPTPETDAFFFRIDIDWDMEVEFARKLERERDEAIRQRNETNESSKYAVDYAMRERDEAREEVKELIYIAERGIALAEIDFENDKFGVVSELRDALERIKEGAK